MRASVLDAALPRADVDTPGSVALDEIDVGALGAELGMPAQRRPEPVERVGRQSRDRDHDVRDAGVHEAPVIGLAGGIELDRTQVLGRRERQADEIVLDHGRNVSGSRHQRHRLARGDPTEQRVARGAAASVPAERLASVGVEELDPNAVRLIRRNDEHAVGADREAPTAHRAHPRGPSRRNRRPSLGIEDDEVVSRAGHLREREADAHRFSGVVPGSATTRSSTSVDGSLSLGGVARSTAVTR
jgi:hypothetical protein